jgi:hypothetical protein
MKAKIEEPQSPVNPTYRWGVFDGFAELIASLYSIIATVV